MPAIKPILAALAVTAAFAGFAYAQQPGADQPTAKPPEQRTETDRPRWRDDGGEERGERWRRRFEERGPMMTMMPIMGGMARYCGPNGARMADGLVAGLERATRPTAEQKTAFDNLKTATTRAAEMIRAACPTEPSVTPPGRLAAAEKGLAAMLEAVRLVRPAMDAYYNSLSDEQKARLYLTQRRFGEMHGGWRGGPDRERWRENRGDRGDERRRPDRESNDDHDDNDDGGPRRL
jgi:hypothetical protein